MDMNEASAGYGEWAVTCPQCGKVRTLRAHKYKDGTVRGADNTCHACRGLNLQKRVSVTCPACGVVRVLSLADSKERLSGYCFRCVKRHSKPKLKGGRHLSLTSRGYVMVVGMKRHPLANRSRQVPEHWFTMYEQHPMGPNMVRWFKAQGFTVHHKNGVRDDNRLDNLELRAPGRHGCGWSIDEMRDIVKRYDSGCTRGGRL
jgi:predicted RNA-binding Zn-ribbon protein involved in translation (DUF1610 family)